MPPSKKKQPATPTGPRLVQNTPAKTLQLEVSHDQIATRAYELFVQEGFAHGHHLDHWLRAEHELKGVVSVARPKRVAGTRARA